MAYDDVLVNRIRAVLADQTCTEQRMFGGLAFLIGGHLAVAASGHGGLMVRLPPDETEALLARDHTEPMMMSGREIRGWLRVSAEGLNTGRKLQSWVAVGVNYAASLPPKHGSG